MRDSLPTSQPVTPTLEIYKSLRLPRTIEEKQLLLVRQGKLSKWFSGFGQEAVSVGVALALEPQDYILPLHRNLGVWTTRGVPLEPLFRQLMGKAGGFTQGRDRTFHFGLPEKRIIGMISHLGAMLPVACGLGLASRLKSASWVAAAFVGEGATREGDFHEALNLAAVWKLPVLFIVENNLYGLSTPVEEVVAVENIADCAAGYGMAGTIVDGNDVLAVMENIADAAARARAGHGPTLLEMKTFRMRGHEEASGTKYVPEDYFEEWSRRDPVNLLRERLLDAFPALTSDLERLDRELRKRVEAAAEAALWAPLPESTREKETRAVFAPASPPPPIAEGPASPKRFVDAVSEALSQAMDADERIILLGQDIAEYGGVFKVTEGLVERFGRQRVRNTPIIESGAVGAAIGLALEGFKPVVEMQYADFISCAFNQIVNNLATTHYRWGAALNVTIRAPFGGSIGAGPFHSQSPEAWFCHSPGLKVVVPGSARDAKGLLLAALEDPNPVLFFEHKFLYRSTRDDVPDAMYQIPLGQAEVVRTGRQATLVTYGIGRLWALQEADYQETRGVSLEVVDLKTLIPWDRETVIQSLRKTGRLLVLHEAWSTAGFGAEIVARLTEEAFAWLDAPPVRVCAEDWPIPFAAQLEKDLFSARAKLRAKLEELLDF